MGSVSAMGGGGRGGGREGGGLKSIAGLCFTDNIEYVRVMQDESVAVMQGERSEMWLLGRSSVRDDG